MRKPKRHIFVCRHSRAKRHPRGSCGEFGSDELLVALTHELGKRRLHENLMVTSCACFGPCEDGPNLVVYPEGVLYSHVQASDVAELFDVHFEQGRVLDRLAAPAGAW